MKDKFDQIPLESDTRLHSRSRIQIGKYDAILESWSWEKEIFGHSVIFCSEEIADLSDREVEEMLRNEKALQIEGSVTMTRTGHYTFINFS